MQRVTDSLMVLSVAATAVTAVSLLRSWLRLLLGSA